MPPGKPFPKISEEQRAAVNAELMRDFKHLLKDLGGATLNHLQNTPQSVIAQTAMRIEADTGALTALARGLSTMMREKSEEQTANKPGPSAPPPSPPKGQTIDAEFIEEK